MTIPGHRDGGHRRSVRGDARCDRVRDFGDDPLGRGGEPGFPEPGARRKGVERADVRDRNRCALHDAASERAKAALLQLNQRIADDRMPLESERVPEFVKNIRRTMDDVEALPQPTIAVVNGFAFGGGTELLLACDLRVAATTAKFGLTEVALAIIPGAGGTQRLPRLVGKSRAKDLILTGRRIDAGRHPVVVRAERGRRRPPRSGHGPVAGPAGRDRSSRR